MNFEELLPDLHSLSNILWQKKVVKFSPKAPGSLRLVSFNAHFGKDVAKIAKAFFSNPNLAIADVILLQEIEHHSNEGGARSEQLAKLFGFHHFYAPCRNLDLEEGTHGIAILSRMPLKNTKVIKLPVYTLLRMRPRVAISGEVEHLGKRVKIYNVHLNGSLNYGKRVLQFKEVLDHIYKDSHKQPVVLAGDFNTIPLVTLASTSIPIFYSNQRKKFHAFLKKHGFEITSQNAGYTSRWGVIRFQLDGIYPKNATVHQFEVERKVKVSDHFPLWADIKVF